MELKKWIRETKAESEVSATTNDESGSVRIRLEKTTTPTDSLNKLLKSVANMLPPCTILREKQCPILL